MERTWASEVGIALDHEGDVPLGVQLDWAIRAALAAGRLRRGERLPALRELAAELGVNHNTLRSAVAKLEAEGLLASRHGSGTYVAMDATADERHGPAVEEAVRAAAEAGLSPRDLAAALYVAGHPAPPAPANDSEAAERRALRADIAALDRVVGELERRLHNRRQGEPARGAAGTARVLSAAELREDRDGLLRRLAMLQSELDERGRDAAETPVPEPGRAPAKAQKPLQVPKFVT